MYVVTYVPYQKLPENNKLEKLEKMQQVNQECQGKTVPYSW